MLLVSLTAEMGAEDTVEWGYQSDSAGEHRVPNEDTVATSLTVEMEAEDTVETGNKSDSVGERRVAIEDSVADTKAEDD